MSVALVGTIGVSLLLAGPPVMAQVPDLVMAAQMTVGPGTCTPPRPIRRRSLSTHRDHLRQRYRLRFAQSATVCHTYTNSK
jgi:hypothetical protein